MLGFVVGHGAIALDPLKGSAILDWPLPMNLKTLRRFLGFANYLRALVPKFAELAAPLDNLRSAPNIGERLREPASRQAFDDLKRAIAASIVRRRYDPAKGLILACDASAYAIAAVLFNGSDMSPFNIIGVFSRKLKAYELSGHPYKKELISIVMALRHFRPLLQNHEVTLFTDHRALVAIQSQPNPHPVLAQYLDELMSMRITYRHLSGALNILADALSRMYESSARPSPANVNQVVSLELAPALQQEAEVVQRIRETHERAHLGVRPVLHDLVWRQHVNHPRLKQLVHEVVRACRICHQFNPQRPLFSAFSSSEAAQPWQVVHMDVIMGFPVTSLGNRYILLLVDRLTRFCVLRPLKDRTSDSLIQALLEVCASHGVMSELRADSAAENLSAIFRQTLERLGVTYVTTTPYAHYRNSPAERTVQTTQRALRKMLAGNNAAWDVYLSLVQFHLNARWCDAINAVPFDVFTGRAALPTAQQEQRSWEERLSDLKERVLPLLPQFSALQAQRNAVIFARKHRIINRVLPEGTRVLVKDENRESKLAPLYVGDFRVVTYIPNQGYVLRDSDQKILERRVDISQLKVVNDDVGDDPKEEEPDQSYEVESIIKHRGPPHRRSYYVAWRGYPESENSWVHHSQFNDLAIVDEYERNIARKSVRELALEARESAVRATETDMSLPSNVPSDRRRKSQRRPY